jgi:hypothetical protein
MTACSLAAVTYARPVPALLLLNAAAVVVALLVARRSEPGARPSAGVLRTLAGYLVVVHSAVLGTGLVGWLTVGGLAMALAIALAAAAWLPRVGACRSRLPGAGPSRLLGAGASRLPGAGPSVLPGARRRGDRSGTPGGAGSRDERRSPAAVFAVLAATVAGLAWTWPHVAHATRLWIWDDYTYHMVYPALWLREHAIVAPIPAEAFTMQAWYPLSASAVAAWFMVAFDASRGDALAWVSLTAPLYAAIVASGVAELLARLQCRRGAWAVPVLLFLTSHRIGTMASTFSDADLAQAAATFGAFVFAIPRADGEDRRAITWDTWYAGLLAGIAVGVKVSAVPHALIVLLLLTLRTGGPSTSARSRLRAALVTAATFAVSWLATGGYWYVRNLVRTGNPVYPAAFLLWPGTTFPETTLGEYSRHYGLGRAVADALVVYMNWPPFHAAVAAVGLVGVAAWLAVRRSALTRSRRFFAGGTLAIAAAVLLLLPSMPYSAGNPMTFRAGFVHWDSMRYVALLPILGWAAVGFLLGLPPRAAGWTSLAAAGITTASLLLSGIPHLASPGVVGALALGAAVLACARVRVPRGWRRGRVLAATAAAIVAAGIVVWSHGAKAAATAAAFHREPLFGGATAALDRLPGGTRIGVFGDQWIYPAFGVRHHLVPVRLDGDGRIATAPVADAMAPGDLTVDPPTFRRNLAMARVGVVAIVHLPHPGRSPAFPPQQAALEAVADARLLHRDDSVAIWRLD